MLREFLETTSLELSNGIPDVYKEHPLAISIREDDKRILESFLPQHLDDYKVDGSAGRGQWADIPWVAIYSSSVTDRVSQGYYLAYLIPNSTNKIIQSRHDYSKSIVDYKVLTSYLVIELDYSGTPEIDSL